MPAWKTHEAGRHGRDAHESDGFYETPHREPARSRIERLTRTATALGRGIDPRTENRHDEDLDAVADELDRLLSERSDAVPSRTVEPVRPVRAEPQRRAPVRDTGRFHRETKMDDVMGALDRLDEQVKGLVNADMPRESFRNSSSGSPRRPDRYATEGTAPDRGYPDAEDCYPAEDGEDAFGTGYEFDNQPVSARNARARRDASMHVYKDLGRRIDALRAPQEQALNQVREELGSLRDALGGISRGTHETVSRQNAELRRLADMVERLRADKKNDQLAKEVRREVADLKDMVGRTNVEGALQTLEHGYAHILQRLDELSRASVDPRILNGVTARLNEIEDAFAALPRSEHMIVLEDRVVTIAERMEELLQRKGHAEIEPLRAELRDVRGFVEQIDIKGLVEGIDDRMKFVSSRLDDLEVLAREQRGLDSRLSAMEERMPEPETISRLQGRLEDIVGMMADDRANPVDLEHLSQVDRRLNEIVDRLDRMELAAPMPSADAGAFEALEQRLEGISGKIDAIEKKTSRPVPVLDAAAMRSGAGPDNKFLAQLQERLNDLTARLDQPQDTVTTSDLDKLREEIGSMRASVAAPVSTDALEKRISDLAQIVSKGGDTADDERFEQLGAKVAALAEQIESNSAKFLDVEQISPVLERIEHGLQQTRADVAGIATKAAQEAVAAVPAPQNDQYEDDINALQGDLKRLLDAAEGSEERTRNTFDGVKSVLGSLTERLDNLERVDGPLKTQTATAASFSPFDLEEAAPVFTKPSQSQSDEKPNVLPDPEADRQENRARDRKADFIAAARRAAQAASAEAAKLEKKQKLNVEPENADEERGKARIGWLRNVLKRDKAKEQDTKKDNPPAAPKETAEIQNEDDLELHNEDVADAAYEAQDTKVLPGDRPAPEASQASGSRRRAILFAAAAVVLVMGTLQAYRFVAGSSDGGQDLAAAPQEEAQPVTASDNSAETAVAVASVTEVAPAIETDSGSAPGNAEEIEANTAPAAIAAAPKVGPEVAAKATAEPRSAPIAMPDKVQSASASSAATSDAELTFAPPTGVASSFGEKPADNPSSFTPTKPAAASTSDAPSALIASLPPEGVGPMALRSAAASGNPAAEFLVGVKYTEGNGVPSDMAKAAAWYQKAADKGLPPAQYRLASLYEKGRGIEKDLPKAKAWYARAAEAGNAKAMHNLAVLYAEGGGGEPNYAEAAKWFEAAANYGVKDSLFNLGILYAGGIGVDKDLVASYKWFAIAADQGDPEAAKRRDDVANMMDQETLANARLAVEGFTLTTPDAAANKVTLEPSWADSASIPAAKASVTTVDNTAMIKEAQDKLNYLGFDTGTPDGQMGPRTRSAIRAFQRSLGLTETGEVDRKLVDELNSQAI
ncbi:peptidoglycan-binding protein [Roseibium sp. SCP14]|uniref:peptidoglycan-binding protein n=1 Tax=Roseibium sp. SCP14 TaxID=3141375 RepID=UPI0033365FC7